jgi:hypothetical protein
MKDGLYPDGLYLGPTKHQSLDCVLQYDHLIAVLTASHIPRLSVHLRKTFVNIRLFKNGATSVILTHKRGVLDECNICVRRHEIAQ